ncbi:MAG TPA: protease modulator HflC [Burkholderiaceae bacterium]
MNRIFLSIAAILVVIMLASSSLFVVDERQVAVVKTLGQVRDVITEPGLNFTWPLVQTVSLLDKRVQTLESPEAHAVFSADKKSLIVDWLVRWRIADARLYIRDNGVEPDALRNRLSAVVQASFDDEIGRHTVRGVLSDDRAAILRDVQARVVDAAKGFGVEVVDVRLKRVDFVAQVTDSVYARMVSERARVAQQLRAEGRSEKERIQADADKQRAVLMAQAQLDAQKTKGEADAQATAIYAEAFGRDPKFAAFYRSLEAYRNAFHSKSDVMVVDTNSEFFKAMRGAGAEDAGARKR